MCKKLLTFFLFFLLFNFSKAQGEFITIWKPGNNGTNPTAVSAPYQATSDQIWFPGIGDHFRIDWEEIGYTQHKGTMADVTPIKQVLIDFGTPTNPGGSAAASYRIKVSNGNGSFKQIRFGEAQLVNLGEMILPIWQIFGSSDKILEIEQWGDISWVSMNGAFATCKFMTLSATDMPKLSNVTDVSFMFSNTPSFNGAPSMQNWNTTNIINFSSMFSRLGDTSTIPDVFNPNYFKSWDISSAEDISYMFASRPLFNQNLNDWNTSNVKNMAWTFGNTYYNQDLSNWDTSKVTNMDGMFHYNSVFNQPISNWNTSNVTTMGHMFHGCTNFNQPIQFWNVGKLTNTLLMLGDATNFNQSLASWNIKALTNAASMLYNTALTCENYSKTLSGWADNINVPNNVNMGLTNPLKYASNAINKRDILIAKGWQFNGDTQGSCFLSTTEAGIRKSGSIYPNPAHDNIHLEDLHDIQNFKILDESGRLIDSGKTDSDMINISSLPTGNYILQIVLKDKIQSFKFIKK